MRDGQDREASFDDRIISCVCNWGNRFHSVSQFSFPSFQLNPASVLRPSEVEKRWKIMRSESNSDLM